MTISTKRKWGFSVLRSLTRSALLATATVGLSLLAAPAQATTHAPTQLNIVALGDSYGSGTGAGDYQAGTGVPNGCWRSANSYSEVVTAQLRAAGAPVTLTNVTCSGASTATLSQTFKGEPPQLDALRQDTHVVFLSIGTNDIGFADYGLQCVLADCSGAPSQAELAAMPAMGQNVTALLAEIKTRSPHANIVVTGYGSQLTAGENAADVPLDPICDPSFFSAQERVEGNQVARALDATLRGAARSAGAAFVSPFQRNSADLRPSFDGHSLCQADVPFYRGFDALAPGQEGTEAVLHLNKAGQSALADLILHKH
jgi:lysophospholipase L1-like esterase